MEEEGEGFLARFPFREAYLESRKRKAIKIVKVLEEELSDLSEFKLLDIGCGSGAITAELSKAVCFACGIDRDPSELPKGSTNPSLSFMVADGCNLPLSTSSFDILVLNYVYEHVRVPSQLLSEAHRVLKPGGTAYFTCPNRFALIEPHYRLPFLSWWPRPLANIHVRLAGKGAAYLDSPPDYFSLRKNLRCFQVVDKTVEIIKNFERYQLGEDLSSMAKLLACAAPSPLLKLCTIFFPGWIFLLRKPRSPKEAVDFEV